MRSVRTHLSPVEDALLSRNTSSLAKAVEDAANGQKYLKTVSVVRRSRSVPAMQRHALEAALASHIVRAKVELDRWHTGVQEIRELRRMRNPDKLTATLANWQFAEDDPVVLQAREDLERWRYIEEQMPDILKKAVEENDIDVIRNSLKELSMSGPFTVEGAREARGMLKRYDTQANKLKEAVAQRNCEVIKSILAHWDFPEDAVVEEGEATIELREEQLRDLKMVVAFERINGKKLAAAVSAWEFENDNEHFRHAVEVLQGFRMESDAMEEILRQEPVNLLQLRIAMDTWSFATDPESCGVLHEAVTILDTYESEVRDALATSDGHAMRELLMAGGEGQALGNDELIQQANKLQSRHSEASNSLLELVRAAPNLEASARADIEEKCKKWAFVDSDPVVELGHSWLILQGAAAESSSKDLEAAAQAGFEGAALGAVRRMQGLPVDSKAEKAAQAAVAAVGRAWRAGGALALGVPASRMPSSQREVSLQDMMCELKGADAARRGCAMESLREVKSMSQPPEIALGVLQVVQALLTGSSSWKAAKDDNSWRGLHDMLGVKFIDHLGEVPGFISTGRRAGVIKARALDAQMRAGPLAQTWSAEDMGEVASVCQSLFVFIEHIFRYDDLLSATFISDTELGPPTTEAERQSRFDAGWKAFQAALKDCSGLPDNRQIAALFLSCGGQVTDLQRCDASASKLVEVTRSRMLKLQASLEDISPFSIVNHDLANNGAAPAGPPSSLTLSMQAASGKVLGKIQISDQATGLQLKQLLAVQSDFDAPSANEQRLQNGAVAVQDNKKLASQGIRNSTALTLSRGEVPLVKRMAQLHSTLRALDPSALAGPGTKHLMKAASYFASDEQPSKYLKVFVEFLHSAIVFVEEVTKGQQPSSSRIVVCERRIQTQMFEFGELPVYHFSVVVYFLKSFVSASQGEVAAVFSEFISVVRKLYDEFLPLYFAWSSSAQAVEEAEEARRSCADASAFGQQLLSGKSGSIFSLQPAAVLEQLEALSANGIVAAAPHMDALSKAAAREVAGLLESPDLAHPALRPGHIEKLLAAHLGPVWRATELLGRLGKRLAIPGAVPQDVVQVSPVYHLMVAVFRIFSKPGDADMEFVEIRRHLAQPKQFAERLATWQPVRDGSVDQLRSAENLLLRLWHVLAGTIHSDASHDGRHRALFCVGLLGNLARPFAVNSAGAGASPRGS
jgi:hypothetical protein